MKRINQDHIVGLVCILISAIVIATATTFPEGNKELNIPGPAFFPAILGIVMGLCGLYHVIRGFVSKDMEAIDFKEFLNHIKSKKVLTLYAVLGLFLFFILFNEIIGFIECMIIVLFLTMKLLRVSWLSTLVGTIVLTVLVKFIFEYVFHVTLPSGILSYLGL